MGHEFRRCLALCAMTLLLGLLILIGFGYRIMTEVERAVSRGDEWEEVER